MKGDREKKVKRAQALYNQGRNLERKDKIHLSKEEKMSIDSLLGYIALGNPQSQPIRSAFLKEKIGWSDALTLAKLDGTKKENAQIMISWDMNEAQFSSDKQKYEEHKRKILKGKL